MSLWLLEARDDLEPKTDPQRPLYDKTFGMVIRAGTEKEAREIGQEECKNGDECREVIDGPWLKKEYSKCEKLLYKGDKGIILIDFNAAEKRKRINN